MAISVSICSNVDGFQTPFCIVDPNTNDLVAQMVRHMTKISDKSYELAKVKFGEAFKMLDRVIRSELPLTKDIGWLVCCFGFNGPLRRYFSLYRAVSQRDGERKEKRFYSILFYPITLEGGRGTTDEFATTPFHLDLFSAALVSWQSPFLSTL